MDLEAAILSEASALVERYRARGDTPADVLALLTTAIFCVAEALDSPELCELPVLHVAALALNTRKRERAKKHIVN